MSMLTLVKQVTIPIPFFFFEPEKVISNVYWKYLEKDKIFENEEFIALLIYFIKML